MARNGNLSCSFSSRTSIRPNKSSSAQAMHAELAAGRDDQILQVAAPDQLVGGSLRVVNARRADQVVQLPAFQPDEVEGRRYSLDGFDRRELPQPFDQGRLVTRELGGMRIEHLPTADGRHGRFGRGRRTAGPMWSPPVRSRKS